MPNPNNRILYYRFSVRMESQKKIDKVFVSISLVIGRNLEFKLGGALPVEAVSLGFFFGDLPLWPFLQWLREKLLEGHPGGPLGKGVLRKVKAG